MIKVLSLGAGVQSSCMALMAAKGEIEMPDCAIFADVGAEPSEVYKYLGWLQEELPFPVHIVSKGNLTNAALTLHGKEKGKQYVESLIPAFTINSDGTKNYLFACRECGARPKEGLRPYGWREQHWCHACWTKLKKTGHWRK